MKCPICENPNINETDLKCPQCESDLSVFGLLEKISSEAKKRTRKIYYIYWGAIILIIFFGFLLSLNLNDQYKQALISNNELKDSLKKENLNRINENKNTEDARHIKENVFRIKVKKGENLWNISRLYYGDGSSYPKIIKLNNLSSNTIREGQIIIIKMDK